MTPEAMRMLLEERLTGARRAAGGKDKRRVSVEMDAAEVTEAVLAVLHGERARFVTIVAVDTGLDIELLYNFSLDGVLLTLRTSVAKGSERHRVDHADGTGRGVHRKGDRRAVRRRVRRPQASDQSGAPGRVADREAAPAQALVGNVIPQARASVENLMIGGTSIRVGPSSAVKREKAGLPRMPPLASANPVQMQEVKDLLIRSGFDKRAGFDRRTGKLRYK